MIYLVLVEVKTLDSGQWDFLTSSERGFGVLFLFIYLCGPARGGVRLS